MAAQINELANNKYLYKDVSDGAYKLYQQMTDWEGWKNTLKEYWENEANYNTIWRFR